MGPGSLGNSFYSFPGSSSLTAKCHPHKVPFQRDTAKCEWVPGVSLWQFKPYRKTLCARHPPDFRLSKILLNVNGPRESWQQFHLSLRKFHSRASCTSLPCGLAIPKNSICCFLFVFCKIFNFRLKVGRIMPSLRT
jgi:hypothetical protein